jgi:predicted lipoprotein
VRRNAAVAGVGVLAALGVAGGVGCRVATVRPLDQAVATAQNEGPSAGPFDAQALVASVWETEVLRALDGAVDAGALARGSVGVAGPAVVRGRGRVVEVDTRSRAGNAIVEMEGEPAARVVVQVGPVLTGTAVRDAIPALGFDRFVNQIQHADVGNELNARVERDVLAGLDRERLRGRRVSFAGMAVVEPGRPPLVTPVRLEVEDRR